MKTRLERLLENLESTFMRINRKADAAINVFPMFPSVITQWQAFELFLAHCYCHMEGHILNVPLRNTDHELHLARCHELLKRVYGANPMQTAFEITRTGNEGGVYGLARRIGETYAQQYVENMVSMTVESYWNHRTPSQLIGDAQEYAEKYKALIPGELTDASAGRMKAQFRKLLNQHPWVVEKMRRGMPRK